MNNHEQFVKYCGKITLDKSYSDKLKEKRNIIRNKIKINFATQGRTQPLFSMQGSFPMKTTIIPLSGEYDLDDGIYIQDIDTTQNMDNWLKPQAVHNWIYKAVDNHTSTPPQRLKKCVRLIYRDGINFHLDLPCYVMQQIEETRNYYIADKTSNTWIPSDPKLVKEWFRNEINQKGEQLRNVIIYLKGWKDYREYNNKSLKLLGGFQLTVLAVNHFVPAKDNDEKSFIQTLEKINKYLQNNFRLDNPVNTNLDLFESYGKTRINAIKEEVQSLYDEARTAYNAKTNIESAELWQDIFGDRFSIPKEEVENTSKGIQNSKNNGAEVAVVAGLGLLFLAGIWIYNTFFNKPPEDKNKY